MTIAIVHDFLSQTGGAERVVLEMADMFPEAPIYTSFYEPGRTFPDFAARDVRTSRLQRWVTPDRFRAAVLLYPAAFRSFDLSAFDRVLISSSAFAHHVMHPRSFVYCHTPPRFLYDSAAYDVHTVVRTVATPVLGHLKKADRRAAARHVAYAANSRGTAARVRDAYGTDAAVIHPPLRTGHLPRELTDPPSQPRALVISRLLPYKRIDVAISACAKVGLPLTIVGEGPEEGRLRALAGRDVVFRRRVDDAELADIMRDHSVVLAPGREDFGYVPLEASYAGRPTVALGAGGALETVVDGVTGVLVKEHDERLWAEAVEEALRRPWSPVRLREWTERFQAPAFRARLEEWLGR